MTVAANNTGCKIPIFVQVMDRRKSMFVGVGCSGTVKTNYDMIVLSRKPPNCNHLSGLLGMFKAKICQPYRLEIPGGFYPKTDGDGAAYTLFNFFNT